jgi:N-acyl-D-amino-acid deacylase
LSEEFDLIIKNGQIVDGTGSKAYAADIGVQGDRISVIGNVQKPNSSVIIDAEGLVVCPGFIDIHSHSDFSLAFDVRLESMIRQGVTTAVVGNCGSSLAPVNEERLDLIQKDFDMFSPPGHQIDITWRTFGEYLTTIEERGCSHNIVPLVGFGAVRIAGGPAYEDRTPTAAELEMMRSLVEEAMTAGAFGLSTGLIYSPQVYARTEEVIETLKPVVEHGGLYFSHIRGEGQNVVQSIKELIEIVEKSGCRGGQIAHHKIAGRPFWGTSERTLQLVAEANERGLDITSDQYPYDRGMTSLVTVLPPWVHIDGIDMILERLSDPVAQDRIRNDVRDGIEGWENMVKEAGWEGIFISSVKTEKWKSIEGESLAEIKSRRGYSDEFALLFELLLDENGEVSMTIASMGDDDIERIMKDKYTMIGTDGWGVSPTSVLGHGKPHPRFYGTYPRVLGKYVREEGYLTLEEAIFKMTGMPAQKLRLTDRGKLREGEFADLVILDPSTIIDVATYLDPHQFPMGISHVIVNGVVVARQGEQSDSFPGRVLRNT